MPNFFFLHVLSGRSFPTTDPHQWLLDNRDDDLLAAARERLTLSSKEPERCLRVVLRRCNLVLIQIVNESQVVVQHWTDPAPDVRVWAKEHRLARTGVRVAFENMKTGRAVVHEDAEDVLMYGVRVGPKFPCSEHAAKYEWREIEEADDHDAATASCTNFLWEGGGPHERLTWQVLKAVWRAERVECPNCDVPLVLIGFNWQMGMLSFRSGRSVRMCPRCRSRFDAEEEKPLDWLASVLPPPLRPTHLRLWGTIPINWPHLSLG